MLFRSEASQSISYGAMAERQRALAEAILTDPDVDSLTSFIGVDGTNVTLNSGRVLINLKPHGRRSGSISDTIRRLQAATASVAGISLYMQPVQDLTIDATVSRTQYRFVLESANPDDLSEWTPKLVDALARRPEFEEVASDMQEKGLAAYVTVDRDSAARMGISAATVDNALYDAFGQRIISTIFTQANQYRVRSEEHTSELQSH